MSIKVWSVGVLAIFSFMMGVQTETPEMTTAMYVGLIALGAWSLGVWLVSVGYNEGKRSKARQSA